MLRRQAQLRYYCVVSCAVTLYPPDVAVTVYVPAFVPTGTMNELFAGNVPVAVVVPPPTVDAPKLIV